MLVTGDSSPMYNLNNLFYFCLALYWMGQDLLGDYYKREFINYLLSEDM